jgi:hypothetical protein
VGAGPPGPLPCRRGQRAEHRALVRDRFGEFRGEAFSASAWRGFAPLVGAFAVLFVPKTATHCIKWIALTTTGIVTALTGYALTLFQPAQAGFQMIERAVWIPQFNVQYLLGTDGISFPMVVLTAIISILACLASFGIKEREKELTEEIEALAIKAEQCDNEEDAEYKDKTGYEIPEELKIKEKRFAKIKAAKEALEQREQLLNPGKETDDKKQISFADKEARIMGKNGDFEYAYNGQITVDKDNQIIVGQHIT